jgi:hypothetical protein
MCNCHSYNLGIGEVPEVVMTHPLTRREVSIDACIAHVIRHLWSYHIWTAGCCCGHNRKRPIVELWIRLDDSYSSVVYREWVREIIGEVDDRDWEIV